MQEKMTNVPSGETATDFRKKDLKGENIQLKDLRGKVVVLNFWFTTCPPCKAEIPDLNALKGDFQNQAVEFLAITFDKNNVLEPFLEKHPFEFNIIPDAHDVIKDFEIIVYPTTIILDKNGKIVHTKTGGSFGIREELKEVIETALRE